jgi:hypothetical protein
MVSASTTHVVHYTLVFLDEIVTTSGHVKLNSDSNLEDFQDAVCAQNALELQGLLSAHVSVYVNKDDIQNNRPALEADSFIRGIGKKKKEPLFVLVPVVWIEVVNQDGSPFRLTTPSRLCLSSNSIVDDLRSRVYERNAPLLQGYVSTQLRVYASRKVFDDAKLKGLLDTKALREDASIRGLGKNNSEALIIFVPDLDQEPDVRKRKRSENQLLNEIQEIRKIQVEMANQQKDMVNQQTVMSYRQVQMSNTLSTLITINEMKSFSSAALGRKERQRLEGMEKISIMESIEGHDPIFNAQQQQHVNNITNEDEFHQFITPILNTELESHSMVYIDSHNHPWLSQLPILRDNTKLKPNGFATHRGMYERREPDQEGLYIGVAVKELYECVILFECKLKIDNTGFGQVVRYLHHFRPEEPAGAILFDRECCWLISSFKSEILKVDIMKWVLNGSKTILHKFITSYKSPWISLLEKACNQLHVEIDDGNSYLGRGGFGLVFRVLRNGDVLALKIVKEEASNSLVTEVESLKLTADSGLTVRFIEGVKYIESEGAAILISPAGTPISRPLKKSHVEVLFGLLRRLHSSGFTHGDCRIQNVIVFNEKVLWIDLCQPFAANPTYIKLDITSLTKSFLGMKDLDNEMKNLITDCVNQSSDENFGKLVKSVVKSSPGIK